MKAKNVNAKMLTSKEIKSSLNAKLMAGIMTSLFILFYGLPFIRLGILIGSWIWR